jgi:hypothetical protein
VTFGRDFFFFLRKRQEKYTRLGRPQSVHRGNFAISVAIHAALIAVVATAGLWKTKQSQLTPHATSVLLTDISDYVLALSIDKSRGGEAGATETECPNQKGACLVLPGSK